MKALTLLLLLVATLGICQQSQAQQQTPPSKNLYWNDVRNRAKNFTDSLVARKIDTVFVFSKDCIECGGINNRIYVAWSDSNQRFNIVRFDSWNGVSLSSTISSLTKYFATHENEIRNQELNKPKCYKSHYYYTNIQLFVSGNEVYNKKITDSDFRAGNEEKRLMLWVQKIESMLYNYEREKEFR